MSEVRSLGVASASAQPVRPALARAPGVPQIDSSSSARDVFVAGPTVIPLRNSAPTRPFALPSTPEWTVDEQGNRADPVTLYVHGSRLELENALEAAGWTRADPAGLFSTVRYVGAALCEEVSKAVAFAAKQLNGIEIGIAGVFGLHPKPLFPTEHAHVKDVDRMPVSPQRLRGAPSLEAYQRDNDPLGGRHHLRIFGTGENDASGQPVFAIAASRDTGIRFAPEHPETGFLFHTVESNVAHERDFVLSALRQGGQLSSVKSFERDFGGESVHGEQVRDGKGYELTLQRPAAWAIPASARAVGY